MVDQHEGRIGEKDEEARDGEAADEGQAEEVPVAQQQPVGGERAADAAFRRALAGGRVSLRRVASSRRPSDGRRRSPPRRSPASRSSSITMLPVSGARIGETLKTSISSDISRAASTPVWRSRTIGARDDHAGGGADALDEAEGDQHVDVGRERAADAAEREEREAEIERRLAADHVGDRAVDDLAEAEGDEERRQAHLHRHRCRRRGSRRSTGSAGRYMSIAKGPMAESRPRTSAFRTRSCGHGGFLSGGGGRRGRPPDSRVMAGSPARQGRPVA